jgi:hypothetical protein
LEIGRFITTSERQRQKDGDKKTDEKFSPDHSASPSESVSPPKKYQYHKMSQLSGGEHGRKLKG